MLLGDSQFYGLNILKTQIKQTVQVFKLVMTFTMFFLLGTEGGNQIY